jgi:hypothetical protein
MHGTHSFKELDAFLKETALGDFMGPYVQVGLASMTARGKGLRTTKQREEVDWLLGKIINAPVQ